MRTRQRQKSTDDVPPIPPQPVPSAEARPSSSGSINSIRYARASERTPRVRPVSLPSTPPRGSPTESTARWRSRRCDPTRAHHAQDGDIADVESGDEPEEISECPTGQWRHQRQGLARALSAPVVPRARPPDSPPMLSERPHLQLRGFAGELAPAFDYPLSPPPEPAAVTLARRESSVSLATASSTRSRSPVSLRKTIRGSENMTLKLLHGHVKSDPS